MKKLPFNKTQIEKIANLHPTPFHLYDEKGIVENARRLNAAFSWNSGFKQYFAVKATPNPYLIKLLAKENFGCDCSSYAELVLSERVGVVGENIMFTSNNTQSYEFQKANELGSIINLDDISHLDFLEECAGLPELLCFRYNPGPLRSGNVIIGTPEDAKYGFTKEQLFEGYKIAKEKGVSRFGLHTMVASNELDRSYFTETVKMLVELVLEISQTLGIRFEFINMGGGIGIPYRPEQEAMDLEALGDEVRHAFETMLTGTPHSDLKLLMECGRMVTGPFGYLITTAQHKKEIYKNYIGVDACMANLMRPGMYGAYHHITVLGKESAAANKVYDVVGSLCENNDKFAVDRKLPEIENGDLLVIHDSGAHGHAMGFNYNGKLRSAELLLREDGSVKEIRRAETLEDHFATLDFGGLGEF